MLFPYFGGKARAAETVWEYLGDPGCYIEPFAGSLAVLLSRPTPARVEIAVDLDGLLMNFWRSIQHWPDMLPYLNGTVSEVDIAAKHSYLLGARETVTRLLREDPYYYNPELAAWWWEGISSWLGQGYGWRNARQRPHIDRSLKGAWANGMTDDKVAAVAKRLGNVVLLAGDWQDAWKRAATKAIIDRFERGGVAVFLDPPYVDTERQKGLYVEDKPLNEQVTEWVLAQPRHVRVVIAGYDDEYPSLAAAGYTQVAWKAPNGYAQGSNERRHKEVLYVRTKRMVRRA